MTRYKIKKVSLPNSSVLKFKQLQVNLNTDNSGSFVAPAITFMQYFYVQYYIQPIDKNGHGHEFFQIVALYNKHLYSFEIFIFCTTKSISLTVWSN